jgi:hypothetical protein
MPTFTASQQGTYIVQLTVSNGVPGVPSDTSTVMISTFQTAPVANAGPDQANVQVNSTVTLNGTGSTSIDGRMLSYAWTLILKPSGSNATLNNPTSPMPTFVPDKPGTYVAQLIVNDGLPSNPDTVNIAVIPAPIQKPIANAGPSQTVTAGTLVQLDGSGSTDPQSLPLTYQWSLIARPTNSTATLNNPTSQKPTFTADQPGTFIAQLIVNNGTLSSDPSTVTISTGCVPPVANAGPAQTVNTGAQVTLDGTGSSDACGRPLTYSWSFTTIPQGSVATLSGANTAHPTFTTDVDGTYVAQLIVSAGSPAVNSNPSTVTVTASTPIGSETILFSPSLLNLTTNPGSMRIILAAQAGPGGQLITLTSSDPTIASVPASVTVPQGSVDALVTVTPLKSGTATITAHGPANSFGVGTVQVVFPTITITLDSNNIGIAKTVNGTVTLSTPAISGAVITLATNPAYLSLSTTQLFIFPGNSTASFQVTGVTTTPAPVTITASTPGYSDGTTMVTVGSVGIINLPPQPVTVAPNQSVPFPISLATGAGLNGVTVTLVSSDPSKATISPSTVTIPFGATAPLQQPVVNGIDFGNATITASATGYTGASQTVQVTATLTLAPNNQNVPVGGNINLTLTLSTNAPASGLTVNLSSSNPLVATVPTSVSFAPNTNTAVVTVHGVAPGSTTIIASAPFVAPGTVNVNVPPPSGIILPQNVSVQYGQTVPFPVTLQDAAPPGGLNVTLTTSDPSRVTISPSAVFVPAGSVVPAIQPGVTGVNIGGANISATASGYNSATQLVKVPATVTFSPNTLTLNAGSTQSLTLNLSAPAPPNGLAINLSSDNPGLVTVPGTVSYAPGANTVSVPVTGVAKTTTPVNIHASALASYVPDTTAAITVNTLGSILLPTNVSITAGQSATYPVMLSAPAPAGGVTVTLSSTDTSKLTIAPTSVVIPAGATAPATQPQITGVNAGQATVNATAPQWDSAARLVTVLPQNTISLSPGNINLTPNQSQTLTVSLTQAAAAQTTVTLTSTDPSKVTVSPSSVVIAQGATAPATQPQVTGGNLGSATINATSPGLTSGSAQVQVGLTMNAILTGSPLSLGVGGSPGTLTINLSGQAPPSGLIATLSSSDSSKASVPATLSIPAGATTASFQVTPGNAPGSGITITATIPNVGTGTASVTVTQQSGLIVPANITVAPNQSVTFPVSLGTAAGAGGVFVSITSSDTSKVTVFPPSILIPEGRTTSNATVTLTGVSLGTATVTASSFGVQSASSQVQVGTGATLAFTGNLTIAAGSGPQSLTLTLSQPAPAGGLTVSLNSSNPPVATVGSGVTFQQGATAVQVSVTPGLQGTATITASALNTPNATATVTVTPPPSITVPANTTVGVSQATPFPVSITPAPASPVTVTLTSSDPSKVIVSPTTIIIGGANPVVAQVNGVSPGNATITATAPNFNPAVGNVTVTQGGGTMGLFPNPVSVTAGSSTNITVSLSSPAPAGLVATLTSSNTGIATVPSSVAFTPGATSATVSVTGVAQGSATITGSAPNFGSATTTVNVAPQPSGGFVLPPNTTITLGQGPVPYSVTLPNPAPSGGVFVTLASSNSGVATISPPSIFIPQGQPAANATILLTPVGLGTTTISASSFGYPTSTGQVQVVSSGGVPNGSLTFSPTSLTITGTATQNLTLTLSPAPASALTVNLSSDNTNVATVASSMNVAAGATSVTVPVTGVATGTANVSASASGYNSGTAAITVTGGGGGGSILFPSNPTVLQMSTGDIINFPVTLSTPAPAGGLTVTLSSSDSSKVSFTPATLIFSGGQTTSPVIPKLAGVSFGSATVSASATGYQSASQQVQVSAITGMHFQETNLVINGHSTQNLTLLLPTPAPAGGLTVNLAPASLGIVSIIPSSVSVPANATSVSIPVTGMAAGTTSVQASASGYSTTATYVTVVNASSIILPLFTAVGIGHTVPVPITLSTPAPMGGVTVSLSSSDTSKFTVSTPSVFIPEGATTPAVQPSITAPLDILSEGYAAFIATAPGYAPGNLGIHVSDAITINVNSPITVAVGQTIPLQIALPAPAPPGGATVMIAVGDTSKASVTATAYIPEGSNVPSVLPVITGLSAGTTVVEVSAPALSYITGVQFVTVQ